MRQTAVRRIPRIMTDLYLGEVKAVYKRIYKRKGVFIKSNINAEKYIRKIFPDGIMEYREIAGAVFLNSSNNVIGHSFLGLGGISTCLVDTRILFQKALLCNAVAFIFFHNHPSGNTKPSKADIVLTEKLQFQSNIMEIKMLDSLIITTSKCVSIGGFA